MEGAARIDPGLAGRVRPDPAYQAKYRHRSNVMAGPLEWLAEDYPSRSGSSRPAGAWADAPMTTAVRAARAALLVAAAGAATVTGVRAGGRALVLRAERRLCVTAESPPYDASERARELHRGLPVVDLHADSLLWGRDLLRRDPGRATWMFCGSSMATLRCRYSASSRSRRAISTSSATTTAGRHHTDRDGTAVAAGGVGASSRGRWFRPSALERRRSLGGPAGVDPLGGRSRRAAWRGELGDSAVRRACSGIEGAHALDGDPAKSTSLYDAGFRMMSLSHFFDNEIGGSSDGVEKDGLTPIGRRRCTRRSNR